MRKRYCRFVVLKLAGLNQLKKTTILQKDTNCSDFCSLPTRTHTKLERKLMILLQVVWERYPQFLGILKSFLNSGESCNTKHPTAMQELLKPAKFQLERNLIWILFTKNCAKLKKSLKLQLKLRRKKVFFLLFGILLRNHSQLLLQPR